jgi:hypothetical protein
VGGVLLSAIFTRIASLGAGDVLVIAPTFALACAACASGSLALARRAENWNCPRAAGIPPNSATMRSGNCADGIRRQPAFPKSTPPRSGKL